MQITVDYSLITLLRAILILLAAPLALCRADVNKQLVDSGKRATAMVEIYEGDRLKGWASAFCVDRSGVFVTNHHVATSGSRNNKLSLVIDSGSPTQRTVKATVLQTDEAADLAILRADRAGNYESVELSDPAGIRSLAETAQVMVFGFPLGESPAARGDARPEASITVSRITALRRDHGELLLIQLDGSINPGNSGGPIIDDRGKVVGIIAAGIPGTAISFAIPANRLGRLLSTASVSISASPHSSSNDAGSAFSDVLADPAAQIADLPGRTAPPTEAARQNEQKLVHELLTSEFADTTPKGRRALGIAMLAKSLTVTDDPAGSYELLSEACDVAAESGDLITAMKAVGEIGRRYDVNAIAMKAGVLSRLAPKVITPIDHAALAAHGLLTAEAMIRGDMYNEARKLTPLVSDAAAASYSVPVQKQVREKLATIDSAWAQYSIAEPAIRTLKLSPNDPDANLAVGRFECFARREFARGLPLLAKGADPALKAVAAADMANPSTGVGSRANGDAWWDQAGRETADPAATDACKARAGYWYRLCVDQLNGLAKKLVEQRLATLPPATSDSSRATAASGVTPAPAPSAVAGTTPVSGNGSAPAAIPGQTAPLPPASAKPKIVIVSAEWGGGQHWSDVTARVQELFNQSGSVPARTKVLHADPTPHWKKKLKITFERDGQRKTVWIDENKEVTEQTLEQ